MIRAPKTEAIYYALDFAQCSAFRNVENPNAANLSARREKMPDGLPFGIPCCRRRGHRAVVGTNAKKALIMIMLLLLLLQHDVTSSAEHRVPGQTTTHACSVRRQQRSVRRHAAIPSLHHYTSTFSSSTVFACLLSSFPVYLSWLQSG